MQNMDLAVVVLIAGLVVVFLMLIILTLIIKLYSTAIHGSSNKKKSKTLKTEAKDSKNDFKPQLVQEAPLIPFDEDQDEIVAAIVAAVSFLEDDDSKQYKIKSVKCHATSTSADFAWGLAGRLEATKPF